MSYDLAAIKGNMYVKDQEHAHISIWVRCYGQGLIFFFFFKLNEGLQGRVFSTFDPNERNDGRSYGMLPKTR